MIATVQHCVTAPPSGVTTRLQMLALSDGIFVSAGQAGSENRAPTIPNRAATAIIKAIAEYPPRKILLIAARTSDARTQKTV
jgi:pyridoxal biosynthesis lyase PdxS